MPQDKSESVLVYIYIYVHEPSFFKSILLPDSACHTFFTNNVVKHHTMQTPQTETNVMLSASQDQTQMRTRSTFSAPLTELYVNLLGHRNKISYINYQPMMKTCRYAHVLMHGWTHCNSPLSHAVSSYAPPSHSQLYPTTLHCVCMHSFDKTIMPTEKNLAKTTGL